MDTQIELKQYERCINGSDRTYDPPAQYCKNDADIDIEMPTVQATQARTCDRHPPYLITLSDDPILLRIHPKSLNNPSRAFPEPGTGSLLFFNPFMIRRDGLSHLARKPD